MVIEWAVESVAIRIVCVTENYESTVIFLKLKSLNSWLNLYLICISRKVLGLNWIIKRVSAPQSIPKLEPVYRSKTHWMKGNLSTTWGKTLVHCQDSIQLITLSAFPKGMCRLLPEWLCFGEKEVIRPYTGDWTLALNWLWFQEIHNITMVLESAGLIKVMWAVGFNSGPFTVRSMSSQTHHVISGMHKQHRYTRQLVESLR